MMSGLTGDCFDRGGSAEDVSPNIYPTLLATLRPLHGTVPLTLGAQNGDMILRGHLGDRLGGVQWPPKGSRRDLAAPLGVVQEKLSPGVLELVAGTSRMTGGLL